MVRVKTAKVIQLKSLLVGMDYELDAGESVSMAVIRAVSALEGREPDAIEPLGNVVDPEALNLLFSPQSNGTPRNGGSISFVYSNCRVTVENGEHLTVELLVDQADPS